MRRRCRCRAGGIPGSRQPPATGPAGCRGRGQEEAFVIWPVPPAGVRPQQPAGLGGEDVRVARLGLQEPAEPSFRQAEAIVRSGVEAADPAVPGGLEDRPGDLVGHRPEVVAEVTGAERQRVEVDAAPGPVLVLAHDGTIVAVGRARRTWLSWTFW